MAQLPSELQAALDDFASRNPHLLNGEDAMSFLVRQGLKEQGYFEESRSFGSFAGLKAFIRELFWPDRSAWRTYETQDISKSKLPASLRDHDLVMGRKVGAQWEYRELEPHEIRKSMPAPLI